MVKKKTFRVRQCCAHLLSHSLCELLGFLWVHSNHHCWFNAISGSGCSSRLSVGDGLRWFLKTWADKEFLIKSFNGTLYWSHALFQLHSKSKLLMRFYEWMNGQWVTLGWVKIQHKKKTNWQLVLVRAVGNQHWQQHECGLTLHKHMPLNTFFLDGSSSG